MDFLLLLLLLLFIMERFNHMPSGQVFDKQKYRQFTQPVQYIGNNVNKGAATMAMRLSYYLFSIFAILGFAAFIIAVILSGDAVKTISGVSPSGGEVTVTEGTGIKVVPNIPAHEVEIKNDGVVTINGVAHVNNNIILSGLTGITMGTGVPSEITIENSGVTSLIAGMGIGVSAATGDVTVSNLGIITLNSISPSGTGDFWLSTGGNPGITIAPGAPNELVITNTGVRTIIGGMGITADSPTGTVTLSNDGVLTVNSLVPTVGNIIITDGAGIMVASAGSTVTISNTGVTDLTGGTGITVSAATGSVLITNDGVLTVNGLSPTGGDIDIVAGSAAITVMNAGNTVTIDNGGVTSNIGGSGVSVSGATGAVTINHDRSVDALTKTAADSTGHSVVFTLAPLGAPVASPGWVDISTGAATAVDGGLTFSAGAVPSIPIAVDGHYMIHAHCAMDIGGAGVASASAVMAVSLGAGGADPTAGYIPPGGIVGDTLSFSGTTIGPNWLSLTSSFHVCASCAVTSGTLLTLHAQVLTIPATPGITIANPSCTFSLNRMI